MEFSPYAEDYFAGAWDTYRWLRDEAPVYYNDKLDFWAFSRYADVRDGLREYETFTSGKGVMLDQLADPNFVGAEMMPGFLIIVDPPKHNRIRRLVSAGFTPKGVAALEDRVRRAILAFLEPLEDRAEFDFVEDFASHFPGQVIFELFGAPVEGHRQLRDWALDFLYTGEVDDDLTNERRMSGALNLFSYWYRLAEERREHPAEDLMTTLVQESFVDDDGTEQRLTDEEIGWYAMMVNAAGAGTTTRLSAGAMVQFYRHPDQWQKVLDDPARLGPALEEVARYDNPVHYIGRKSTKEITRHGVTVPAGSNFLMLIGSANRDERVFERPDVFDIDREMPSPPLNYGSGPHVCLGAHLARLEARLALEEFAARWPRWEVDEVGLERVKEVATNGWSKVPMKVGQPAVRV